MTCVLWPHGICFPSLGTTLPSDAAQPLRVTSVLWTGSLPCRPPASRPPLGLRKGAVASLQFHPRVEPAPALGRSRAQGAWSGTVTHPKGPVPLKSAGSEASTSLGVPSVHLGRPGSLPSVASTDQSLDWVTALTEQKAALPAHHPGPRFHHTSSHARLCLGFLCAAAAPVFPECPSHAGTARCRGQGGMALPSEA